ncbi:multidrug transporter [Pedobacter cryoconitis]|uniref:Multidrug transporter n=1 Tax=Pedobacter cryoconitis TaxID=188932 RepID=A0A127VF09_9SPHI|nr:efflux RND transporter periplasmic adaptor subunit [Pedobacter cryoconitis]AMP99508.1 multidrug transporter [Pedobacter cryoconitis]
MRPILSILTAAGATLLFTGCSGHKESSKIPDTINVKTINLSSQQTGSSDQIIYSGTLQADKMIDLSFQVSGTINSFPVKAGDYVKKGQLVATVDETTYRNQYNAQLAQVKLAKENYTRILSVFQKGSIAEIKMLEAKSNLDQAASAARATYQNIAHTRLYAPQSGYASDKKTEAGATASPGVPVLQLLDTRSVNVLVAVPENEINRYQPGDPAAVTIDASANTPIEGRITEVGVLALNNSANYTVKVKLANPGQALKPGMLCKVVFSTPKSKSLSAKAAEQQLVVPAQAVQVDEHGRNYVYTVNPQHKAQRKEVQTGALYNNGLAITGGLSGDEQLITSGYQKLADQSPVKITQ